MRLLAFALISTAFAATIHPRDFGKQSHAQPTGLPIDWHILSQAAGLSRQTYCPQQDAGIQVGDSKLLWSQHAGILNQRVDIFHSPRLGVSVAFQGTTDFPPSIIHDADFPLVVPDGPLTGVFPPGVSLFQGFMNAYNSVADETIAHAMKFVKEYNDYRITVTGHSQGAAMAAIAGAHYKHALPVDLHVYVFGLPRTGNQQWADYIDEKLGGRFYHVVNGRDWVPRVPPQGMNYQHPSGQIWIREASTTDWAYYPGQENVNGPNSVTLKLSMEDHRGVYFHTNLGGTTGPCPALVNSEW